MPHLLKRRREIFRGSTLAAELSAWKQLAGTDFRGVYTPNFPPSTSGGFVDKWSDAAGILPDLTASGSTRPGYNAATGEVTGDGLDDLLATGSGAVAQATFDLSLPYTIFSVIRWNDGASANSYAFIVNPLGTQTTRAAAVRASSANVVQFQVQGSVAAYTGNPGSGLGLRRAEYVSSDGNTAAAGRISAQAEATAVVTAPAAGTATIQLCSRASGLASASGIRCVAFMQRKATAADWTAFLALAARFHPFTDF